MTRVEEERTQKRLFIIAGSIVVILILLFTVGIPLIIKAASFLADSKSSGPSINGDTIPPLPPTLSPLLSATNSATLKVSGYAEPEATLKLIVDDEEVKKVVLGTDGQFEFTDIKLAIGVNSIKAIAVDTAGNESSPSQIRQITYKKKAPKLEISEPTDNQEYHQKDHAATFKGETDPDVDVTINGRFVNVAEDGKFMYTIQLSDGENKFTILASDTAGNQTKLEKVVKYSP